MTDESIVRCLNNTDTYYCRCTGYCGLHKCYVTIKQMKNRQCTYKNNGFKCRYFVKNQDHWYFQRKKEKKLNKSINKILNDYVFGGN